MSGSTVRLLCTETALCSAHASGEITTDHKCPGMCDSPGCREPISDTIGQVRGPLSEQDWDDGFCAGHLALMAAGAEGQELLDATIKAARYGVTLARLLREALRMIPSDPGA